MPFPSVSDLTARNDLVLKIALCGAIMFTVGGDFVSCIIDFAVAFVLLVVGVLVFKGNYGIISIFRSKKVNDVKGYCKDVGKTIMYMGVIVAVSGVICLLGGDGFMEILSTAVSVIGIVLCLVLAWIYGKKYSA